MTTHSQAAPRHALVTGAGSGIGAAIARSLVAAGHRVTLAGRDGGKLRDVAASLPPDEVSVVDGFDVTDAAAIAHGLSRARDRFGRLDILVNNAGEAPSAPFDKTSLDLWSRVIAVDLTSVFQVSQAALPDLRAAGTAGRPMGRIVNIASTAGLVGYGYVAAYCAAKHGVVGLTRALALELARSDITVNAVCPGFTDTPLIDRAVGTIASKTGRSTDAARAELARANPQGRLVDPAEVADAVRWLVSPGASSITGQAIVVAGGEVMAG